MRFRRVQELSSRNSTIEPDVQFIDQNTFLGYNIPQFDTWSSMNELPQANETFNFARHNSLGTYSNVRIEPWMLGQANYDFSFGLPLIFSISSNAEKLLLGKPTLKRDVLGIVDIVDDFVSARKLKAIGEMSIFQEDESEPKLFITYGILHKRYEEILKLWDEVCEELMKSIPVESLEKVAIVFDQF